MRPVLRPSRAAATGYGQAFHIVTSLPVVAYDALPFGGDGELDAW